MCSILTLPCTTSYFPFTTGKSVTAALYRTRQRFFVGFVDWQPMTSSPTGCYRTYWCFTSSTSTPNRRRPSLSNCYLFKKRWFSQETKQLAGELIAGKRPTLAKCITLGTIHTNLLPPSFLSYHSSFYQHVRAPLSASFMIQVCSQFAVESTLRAHQNEASDLLSYLLKLQKDQNSGDSVKRCVSQFETHLSPFLLCFTQFSP